MYLLEKKIPNQLGNIIIENDDIIIIEIFVEQIPNNSSIKRKLTNAHGKGKKKEIIDG
tara:strand:+ start:196 stop:369 length:174 start_codon:yes stop_codon:yes gene_type:complete